MKHVLLNGCENYERLPCSFFSGWYSLRNFSYSSGNNASASCWVPMFFRGGSSRKLYGVGIFCILVTRSSSVRRPAIKSWNPSCYILSYDSSTIATDDVYFWAKQCTRLRRKFSCLRVFTGHRKAVKSKKFICHAWIVMELDWSPWKLLVNENSVIEIRYCRCQSKEIASMIEMSNHGTNFIEKQSLCLFNWSVLKRKPITKGKFWKKFSVTAYKVIEKVLTFEELRNAVTYQSDKWLWS